MAPSPAQFEALFNPRGVVVAGASTHPGKFGFVSLHNILASGYEGKVFATNLDGAPVLGINTVPSIDDLPDGEADLVFVCTPKGANPDLLRACARKGITAAFLTSAGYGEAGEQGRVDEAELVALCDELGIERAIFCGYSMGGPVAQLMWRRHPHLVGGLVFCATSSSFIPALQQRMIFAGSMALMASTTRTTQMVTRLPRPVRHALPKGLRGTSRPSSIQVWAAQEMRRHDMRMVLEAGTAIGTFSSRRWIGTVEVPTTVLITTKDRAVSPSAQLALALAIPGATIQRYDEGHTSPVLESFGTAITGAVHAPSIDIARPMAWLSACRLSSRAIRSTGCKAASRIGTASPIRPTLIRRPTNGSDTVGWFSRKARWKSPGVRAARRASPTDCCGGRATMPRSRAPA